MNVCLNIGFPCHIRKFDNQIHFNFIQFAKLCRAVKITIHIHSRIVQFNFSLKGICIYVIQFKKCITSIQIRDRTSRRLNWMTRLRK